MNAFYTTAVVAAVCGIVLGSLLAQSWFGFYLGLRLSVTLGGVLFLLVIAGVAALLERRKRCDDGRWRGSERDNPR